LGESPNSGKIVGRPMNTERNWFHPFQLDTQAVEFLLAFVAFELQTLGELLHRSRAVRLLLAFVAFGVLSISVAKLLQRYVPPVQKTLPPPKTLIEADAGQDLAEKRKDLLQKCQQALEMISKMPSVQKKQMAALASEADAGLRASGRIPSGTSKVPSPDAPKRMLDDVEFFVSEITRCSQAMTKKQPCALAKDAQTMLRSFTEREKSQALKNISNFCRE
jgi:hypothetical protein